MEPLEPMAPEQLRSVVQARLSMFRDERLRKPWFKTVAGADGVGTQDLYFWNDARKYGYRCAIDCDVLVGHYDLDGKFGPPETMW